MPVYIYRAKDGPGKTVDGELEAESRTAALAGIDSLGYSPVWVREKDPRSKKGRLRRRRISQRDITVFTRQLSSLIRSGVPILKALSTISNQTDNAKLVRVVEDLERTVRDGNMLSGALKMYPVLFPELYVNMVTAGEAGGMLDTTLSRLAEALEKEEETRKRIQAAMAYPVLILVVGIITVFILLSFFLPRVVALFADYGDLPLPTRILIAVTNFFSERWPWIALSAVLLAAVVKRLTSLDKGRLMVDTIVLHLPLIRRFVTESDIARFARTLALLVDAGIPIDRALGVSVNTLGNSVLRAEIEDVRQRTVQQGMSLSFGLRRARDFPDFVANMVGVGEESGRLEESLIEVATFYEKEVDQQARLATSLIEPILILVVGVIVGFIVSAMLLPIFEIGTRF